MRRVIFFFLLAVTVLSLAASPLVFLNDDSLWQAASALTLAAGVNPPSSVFPMAEDELSDALSRIDAGSLDRDGREMLSLLLSKEDERVVFSDTYLSMYLSPVVSPEFIASTSTLERAMDSSFALKERLSLLDIRLRLYAGEGGFAFADYLFISPGMVDNHSSRFTSSWQEGTEFQHEGILNAGIVYHNPYFYGGVFRTRQSMGYGRTGNFIVGDNFSRQDFLRYHFHSRFFDYTLNYTSFAQSESTDNPDDVSFTWNKFNGMQQSQGVHRFEARVGAKAVLVFQEGVMMNTSSSFDFRWLNPFIYFHGLYNFSESRDYYPGTGDDEENNYISLEASLTPVGHLRFNLQILVDQIQLPGEAAAAEADPNGFGVMLGVETAWILGRHYLDLWAEGVWVMPNAYLNLKVEENGKYNTNMDAITGYRNNNQQEVGYAGYTYGPDNYTFAIGAVFGIPKLYMVKLSALWSIHGIYGYGYGTILPMRGPEHVWDNTLAGTTWSDAEHSLRFKAECSAVPYDGVTVKAALGYVRFENYRLEKGRTKDSLQLQLGVSLSVVDLFL